MEGLAQFVIAAFSVRVVQQIQGAMFSVQQVLPAQIIPAVLPDSHTRRSNKRSRSKRQFLLLIVIVVTMINCLSRFVQRVGWIRSMLDLYSFSFCLSFWQLCLALQPSCNPLWLTGVKAPSIYLFRAAWLANLPNFLVIIFTLSLYLMNTD